MIDILYLSIERLTQLRTVCSDELLINVLEAFANNHKIIVSKKEQPKGLWCLDEFPKDSSTHRINKAFVFVSFAYFGGFFQLEEGKTIFGDMNLLNELLNRHIILEEEYNAFIQMIYEARQGIKPLHFDLYAE